ncbi:alpha/beta-hydrolase [Trichodelitschia bisporula]|uniref:Alpha/beta-hydrolase n=1 Tax=Trichodelitschia bisporula TaxID=703511 RepID=A0A6G1HYM6_9PEZI|nr:alpha/beta-hydrolase [Trichodelitschia bisporula]
MKSLLPLLALAALALAAPQQQQQPPKWYAGLPTVKLPNGEWQAAKYDTANDLYVFKNIRFAAPPVGRLRFAKPAPPAPNTTLQLGAYGPSCPQSVPGGLLPGGLTSSIDVGSFLAGAAGVSEDCLFLDVYVPAKAWSREVGPLPVVNWIYGGAYLLGNKEGQYDGTPVVRASGGNLIYVAGNYRLGAFGFLAGETMEKSGAPNAGLWDQRAVLEWIQANIGLFNGDPGAVSVWGESAGAGSILHHLTAFGGTKPALFKRAVAQSMAYDAQIDRKGQLEKQFQEIAKLAGCATGGIECLRGVSTAALKAAQDKYINTLPGGKPGFGPAVDGDLVRQMPPLELASGNVAKGVESIINSHTSDEAKMFTPAKATDSTFTAVTEHYFGTYPPVKAAIAKKYDVGRFGGDQVARIHDMFQFSTFTCSSRFVSEGFKGKTYNVQYSRGGGMHGSDIAADFYVPKTGLAALFTTDRTFGDFATNYQSYLISHARSGDPNKFRGNGTIAWPAVTWGPTLKNVLDAGDKGFALIEDPVTKEGDCEFWKDAFAGMTSGLGFAPPGAVVQSSYPPKGNPSANYKL